MKKTIEIMPDLEGRKIVIINDIRFKGKRNVNWCLFNSDADYGPESNCGKRYSLVFRLCTISACTGSFRTGR